MWNDLPADVVRASTVKGFNNQLEDHLKNLPRRPSESLQQHAPFYHIHWNLMLFTEKGVPVGRDGN